MINEMHNYDTKLLYTESEEMLKYDIYTSVTITLWNDTHRRQIQIHRNMPANTLLKTHKCLIVIKAQPDGCVACYKTGKA